MTIRIQALQVHHDTESFQCGSAPLDDWLRRVARQHGGKGVSRTFVAVDPDMPDSILGFYSLTVGTAEGASLPPQLAKRLPKKIPIVLIGRLATAEPVRGAGIGGLLLIDALRRTVRVASEVGIAAILVDAKDQNAARFYEHFGFQPLPDAKDRLVLNVNTAATLFD